MRNLAKSRRQETGRGHSARAMTVGGGRQVSVVAPISMYIILGQAQSCCSLTTLPSMRVLLHLHALMCVILCLWVNRAGWCDGAIPVQEIDWRAHDPHDRLLYLICAISTFGTKHPDNNALEACVVLYRARVG